MPVTFKVANHPAKPFARQSRPCKHASEILTDTWGKKNHKTIIASQMLQSSLVNPGLETLVPFQNGFVDTVTMAYNFHQHLVLRPDDVWIAILGQLSHYVNAHSEELREQFVAHEGKKVLTIYSSENRFTADFGEMAQQMSDLLDENVVDKELKNWILPDFSTTSHTDTVVCAVLMMATLKAYFHYVFYMECGIPSVTLQGEKSDWQKLLKRVDKLDSFGEEPKAWAILLRPILRRFVGAFDGEPDVEFWSKVCHREPGGSGPAYLSGWITAFCVWSSEGKWQGPPLLGPPPTDPWLRPPLLLDDATYTSVDVLDIPPGFCEVDVKLMDNGEEFDCLMVSGHVAMQVYGKTRETVSPFPAWFMFVKDIDRDGDPENTRKDTRGYKLVKALRDSRLGRGFSRVIDSLSSRRS